MMMMMMMMAAAMLLETSVSYRHMMRLIAREDFVEFSLHESWRIYKGNVLWEFLMSELFRVQTNARRIVI